MKHIPKKHRNKTEEKPTTKRKRIKVRVPRPMGVTALCKEFNRDEIRNETHPIPPNKLLLKEKIHKLYIHALMNNQLIEYDNITKEYKLITITRVAYLLNTSTIDIMTKIAKEMGRMGILMDRQGSEIARGALLRSLFEASELSALTSQQLAILMASQGSTYKPFISGEVNRAMANKIAAMKPTLDLLKLMLDKQSSNIGSLPVGINQADPNGTKQGSLLTLEMAHNLLNQGIPTVMTDGQVLDEIILKDNALKLLPETNPNYQGGDILSSKSLYQDIPEDLKEADHTEKNKARKGFQDIEDSDDFRA